MDLKHAYETHCRISSRGEVLALPHYRPTLPSLVTAGEYRSYCDLLYVHQVPGHGPRMGSACNIESRPTTCQVLRPLVVLESAPSAEVNKML